MEKEYSLKKANHESNIIHGIPCNKHSVQYIIIHPCDPTVVITGISRQGRSLAYNIRQGDELQHYSNETSHCLLSGSYS